MESDGVRVESDGVVTIFSRRGSVRGVKSKVRKNVGKLVHQDSKSEHGKCVLYLTSLGIIRSTQENCLTVTKILRNLLIKYEERDVSISRKHLQALREKLGCRDKISVPLPQLFVNGRLIGGSASVEFLNENGLLRRLLRPFQKEYSKEEMCRTCGGYKMHPCTICSGSRKSSVRNRFTVRALRCTHCNKAGLVPCQQCSG